VVDRQLVQDTNKGNVVPETAKNTAPSTAPASEPLRTFGKDSSFEAADALISIAKDVSRAPMEAKRRKDIIQGKKDAGTEEGIKRTNEASSTVASILFGPSARTRSAQETIVKNTVNESYMNLQLFLSEKGKELEEGDWDKHIQSTLNDLLEPHSDSGIRDLITESFSDNLQPLSRDYIKQSTLYKQQINYESTIDSLINASDVGNADFLSGDPDRVQDALSRAEKAFGTFSPDMSRSARHNAITAAVMSDFGKGRKLLFDAAVQAGYIEDMDPANKEKIRSAFRIYQAQNDRTVGRQFSNLQYLASQGAVSAVEQQATALQQAYPELFPQGINGIRKTAQDAARVKQLEAQNRYHNALLLTHDPEHFRTLPAEQQSVAIGDYLRLVSHDDIKKERQQSSTQENPYDPRAPITPADEKEYWSRNIPQLAELASFTNVDIPVLKTMGTELMQVLSKPDKTEQDHKFIMDRLEQFEQIRVQAPLTTARHIPAEDLALFSTYDKALRVDGMQPDLVYRLTQNMLEMKQKGTLPKVEDLPEDAREDALKEIRKDMEKSLKRPGRILRWTRRDFENEGVYWQYVNDAFDEGYQMTGSAEYAARYASTKIQANMSEINGVAVPNGKHLDRLSVNGDFERYFQGITADPYFRQRMREQHGIDKNIRFDSPDIEFLPDPEGNGIIMLVPTNDKTRPMAAISIKAPTNMDEILPTAGERARAMIGKTALSLLVAPVEIGIGIDKQVNEALGIPYDPSFKSKDIPLFKPLFNEEKEE